MASLCDIFSLLICAGSTHWNPVVGLEQRVRRNDSLRCILISQIKCFLPENWSQVTSKEVCLLVQANKQNKITIIILNIFRIFILKLLLYRKKTHRPILIRFLFLVQNSTYIPDLISTTASI